MWMRSPPGCSGAAHRQHPAVAVVHAAAHDLDRARPGGAHDPCHRGSTRTGGRDRGRGSCARTGDDDESAARRGVLDHLRHLHRGRCAWRAARRALDCRARARRLVRPCRGRVGRGQQVVDGAGSATGNRLRGLLAEQSGGHAAAVARPRAGACPGRRAGARGRNRSAARSSSGLAGIVVGLFLLYFVRDFRGLVGRVPRRTDSAGVHSRSCWREPSSGFHVRPRSSSSAGFSPSALPTTVIDTYQRPGHLQPASRPGLQVDAVDDVDSSRRRSPGCGRTPATRTSCRWSRSSARREHWTLIPSFAGRRMAAGQPISLAADSRIPRAIRAGARAVRDHQR